MLKGNLFFWRFSIWREITSSTRTRNLRSLLWVALNFFRWWTLFWFTKKERLNFFHNFTNVIEFFIFFSEMSKTSEMSIWKIKPEKENDKIQSFFKIFFEMPTYSIWLHCYSIFLPLRIMYLFVEAKIANAIKITIPN